VLKLIRELWDVSQLNGLPPEPPVIIAYAEDIATWSVLGPYIESLGNYRDAGGIYVTSAPNDPRLAAPPAGFRAVLLARTVPYWLSRARAGALLTTMPDIGSLHVRRPPSTTPLVYAFHSLISTHEGYRPGAFDHYDVFFCAGPHHRRELEAHFRKIGRSLPLLLDIGYPKLDALAARFAARVPRREARPTVLVAPSWGAGNVLEAAGVEVIARLRATGVRVVVRPHPCFWLPIYPRGRQIIERIREHFSADPEVVVERNIDTEDALLEADLLVSDFSGVAYEYAFGTRRPVLFFDGARKTFNPQWRDLGLPAFEDDMRREVGELIAPDRVSDIGLTAERLLRDGSAWGGRLGELRLKHVYQPGRSAEAGAAALRDIVAGRERAVTRSAARH
jgi:YidC/Oxa1 family membrane protein insertase